MTEIHYNKGEIDGEMKGYYQNGKLKYTSPYTNGKINGHYKAYDDNGNLTEELLYKNGRFIEQIYKEQLIQMKKILIILTFLFISIFSYSADIDFNIRVMMGLTKIEEKDNPKYKKFLNYIDENLAKKGEVKYSHKVNIDRKVVKFFSEKGEILLTENLPKEFLDIVDNSIKVAVNKEEIKKLLKIYMKTHILM